MFVDPLAGLSDLIKASGMITVMMPTKVKFICGQNQLEFYTSGLPIKKVGGVQASMTKWSELSEFIQKYDDFGRRGWVHLIEGPFTFACVEASYLRLSNQKIIDGIEAVLDSEALDLYGNPIRLTFFEDTKIPKEERCVFVSCALL